MDKGIDIDNTNKRYMLYNYFNPYSYNIDFRKEKENTDETYQKSCKNHHN